MNQQPNNRSSRRQVKREIDKSKNPPKLSVANEPTRSKRRSLMKMLRKPTKPYTKISSLSKTQMESLRSCLSFVATSSLGD